MTDCVQVLATGCLFLGIHVLEGYILLPLVQRRAVEMPPALTVVLDRVRRCPLGAGSAIVRPAR